MKTTGLLLLLCLLLCSCTNRQIYNTIQARERNECLNLPRTQQQECTDRAGVSYDDYNNAREDL